MKKLKTEHNMAMTALHNQQNQKDLEHRQFIDNQNNDFELKLKNMNQLHLNTFRE